MEASPPRPRVRPLGSARKLSVATSELGGTPEVLYSYAKPVRLSASLANKLGSAIASLLILTGLALVEAISRVV